jgi:hypothetical protein
LQKPPFVARFFLAGQPDSAAFRPRHLALNLLFIMPVM